MIDIYTDGACSGNPGPGGWGAIVIDDGNKRVLRGGDDPTTNNRMEMLAVIEGLRSLPKSSQVTVHTDSTYVINTMTKGWKRKANQDLWADLDQQVNEHRVSWQWVRGHSGHVLNEEADSVAFEESQTRAGRMKPRRQPLSGASEALDSSGAPKAPQRPGTLGTPEPAKLTHVDAAGQATMVDVGAKSETRRTAKAEGRVNMKPETVRLISENAMKKGDVLGVARVAGIMAAKQTHDLIPLCHPLPLDSISVDLRIDDDTSSVHIEATASTSAKTGVEMEALTAVSVAALTVYDMCKAVDRGMRIDGVRLLSKTGGKSDFTASS